MKKKLLIFTATAIMTFGLTACNQTTGQSSSPGQSGQTAQNTQTTQPTQSAQTNTAPSNTAYIGEEKALSIALENAGLTQDALVYSQVHLDADDGIMKYDVEFFLDNKEYDYEIHAVEGTILSYDSNMESSFLPNASTEQQASGQNTASVSLEAATQTALAQVPGAASEHIRIASAIDDGRSVYEGKIIYNDMEYDFEIDAATGNITEWEAESIYD